MYNIFGFLFSIDEGLDTYDIRFSFQCEDFDDLIVVIGDHDNWNNW